ncbi:hypothetical protein F5148DRAFT_1152524 [Russula earlei]|uniref:Uncharacterized protein n=1 Tax=Russula earlei TaxID=71964 RepID=A0ACC0TWW8_9AGAM|nr:hypothetical protein F5148DRAFT_1152524 [Russula earlei]
MPDSSSASTKGPGHQREEERGMQARAISKGKVKKREEKRRTVVVIAISLWLPLGAVALCCLCEKGVRKVSAEKNLNETRTECHRRGGGHDRRVVIGSGVETNETQLRVVNVQRRWEWRRGRAEERAEDRREEDNAAAKTKTHDARETPIGQSVAQDSLHGHFGLEIPE